MQILLIADCLNALMQISVEFMEPEAQGTTSTWGARSPSTPLKLIPPGQSLGETEQTQLYPQTSRPPSQATPLAAGEVEVLVQGEQHILEEEKPLALGRLAALKGLLHVLHVARGVAMQLRQCLLVVAFHLRGAGGAW